MSIDNCLGGAHSQKDNVKMSYSAQKLHFWIILFYFKNFVLLRREHIDKLPKLANDKWRFYDHFWSSFNTIYILLRFRTNFAPQNDRLSLSFVKNEDTHSKKKWPETILQQLFKSNIHFRSLFIRTMFRVLGVYNFAYWLLRAVDRKPTYLHC